jgi:hypothetical protein
MIVGYGEEEGAREFRKIGLVITSYNAFYAYSRRRRRC